MPPDQPKRQVVARKDVRKKATAIAGKYYLFVIAIDHYEESDADDPFNSLNNPVLDACRIVEELTTRYRFPKPVQIDNEWLLDDYDYDAPVIEYDDLQVKCLYNKNATIKNINRHLNKLKENVEEEDCILIYFAGHGTILNDKGFIIPFDADNDDNEGNSWLQIIQFVDRFDDYTSNRKCRHLLIVLDSCYSGAAFLGATGVNKAGDFSRYVLTSAMESGEASDGEAGIGSPFANAILSFLQANTTPYITLDITNLKERFDREVEGSEEQKIFYQSLPSKENGMGEFIFELKEKKKPPIKELSLNLIEHLNFKSQKGELEADFLDGAEDIMIISTLGYSFDAQKFLSRVIFRQLEELDIKLPNGCTTVIADLTSFENQNNSIWQLLSKQENLDFSTEDKAKSEWINWVFNCIKRDTKETVIHRPLVIWIGFRIGTLELLRRLIAFCRDFVKAYQTKKNEVEKDIALDKLFIILSDEREGQPFLQRMDYANEIGNFPKIVVTSEIDPINIIHTKLWIKKLKQAIKTEQINNLSETIFFPGNNPPTNYKLFSFIQKLCEHCGFNEQEKIELTEVLLNFEKPLI